MEFKPWYPSDFRYALSNTISEKEVTEFLGKRGCAARFVYSALMLPTVLKYFLDMDQEINVERNMTQATLYGYRLYYFAPGNTPVIAPSSDPQAAVEGLLIFGLDEQQRNEIYELEAGLARLANVQVEICQKHSDGSTMRGVRAVDAGTFIWDGSREGLVPVGSAAWPLDDFLLAPFYEHIVRSQHKGWGDITLLLPRLFGRAQTRSVGTLESIQEELDMSHEH